MEEEPKPATCHTTVLARLLTANSNVRPETRRAAEAGSGTAMMVLPLSVTAPLMAKTRPFTVAPALRVSDVKAMRFPEKSVPAPRVAELPTWKKTLS